jgi:ribosome-associated heat shock protein Hsp15
VPPTGASRQTIRLDKWLWHARFFRTRSLAARIVAEGRVRLNAERTEKPARAVGPGDVLTFPQGARVRVVRVLATGARRGPPDEAATLYEDLAPAAPLGSA